MRHLHIARELRDRVGEARACWSLGNAYSALQRTDLALHYTTLHLDISRQVQASHASTVWLHYFVIMRLLSTAVVAAKLFI